MDHATSVEKFQEPFIFGFELKANHTVVRYEFISVLFCFFFLFQIQKRCTVRAMNFNIFNCFTSSKWASFTKHLISLSLSECTCTLFNIAHIVRHTVKTSQKFCMPAENWFLACDFCPLFSTRIQCHAMIHSNTHTHGEWMVTPLENRSSIRHSVNLIENTAIMCAWCTQHTLNTLPIYSTAIVRTAVRQHVKRREYEREKKNETGK